MDLSFKERSLRDLCGSEKNIRRNLGSELAAKLIGLLADLRVVSTLGELPVRAPKFFDDHCIFELSPKCRVKACPHPDYKSVAKHKQFSWQSVIRIKILDIEVDK